MPDRNTLPEEYRIDPGSFRDRNGRVVYLGDAVYRTMSSAAVELWEQLTASAYYKQWTSDGRLIRTERVPAGSIPGLDVGGEWKGLLRHERIPFITYPYEWSFSMLKDAALLQLSLLKDAVAEDWILKDASSYNIQWKGVCPVFIDLLSFERLQPGTPWAGYKQFCELFLYPLMLQAYKNFSYHPWLRGRVDGIDAQSVRNCMSLRDLFRRGVFTDVVLQAAMQSQYANNRRRVKDDIRSAGFDKKIIVSNLCRLEKTVSHLHRRRTKSEWSEYADLNSYNDTDTALKTEFVEQSVRSRRRRLAWDLGCNTGRYSRIAGANTETVIAMDSDELVIDTLYSALRKEHSTTILPLVMNIADISPGLGWKGGERKPFTDRGTPDIILALALLHHIVIGANIPMAEFIGWLTSFGAELIIEYISKDDPMTTLLLRNKEDQYPDYSLGNFEKCLERNGYAILRKKELTSGTRIMFHAKHPGTAS